MFIKRAGLLAAGAVAGLLTAAGPAGAAASAATTTRVTVSSTEVQANGYSSVNGLSADGRYVLFESEADNLVPHDTNGAPDLFVRDRQAGTTRRVNVSSTGAQANGESFNAHVSPAPRSASASVPTAQRPPVAASARR